MPFHIAHLIDVHFTPVIAARAVGRLLTPQPGDRVLDLGSGVGKFCITAALDRPDVTFVGVERRAALVAIARATARRLGADNVEFIHGDALTIAWTGYVGFYLFNPFGEHSVDTALQLDDDGGVDADRFFEVTRRARERLRTVPAGTRVVTYHGYGRPAPHGFDISYHTLDSGPLERWVRR